MSRAAIRYGLERTIRTIETTIDEQRRVHDQRQAVLAAALSDHTTLPLEAMVDAQGAPILAPLLTALAAATAALVALEVAP